MCHSKQHPKDTGLIMTQRDRKPGHTRDLNKVIVTWGLVVWMAPERGQTLIAPREGGVPDLG